MYMMANTNRSAKLNSISWKVRSCQKFTNANLKYDTTGVIAQKTDENSSKKSTTDNNERDTITRTYDIKNPFYKL